MGRFSSGLTEVAAPCFSQTRPASPSAVCQANPISVVCPGFGLDMLLLNSRTCLT